ncbi:MAG: UvrB/UvrC motif-containing protein, partial [Clostridia bacterium]|nr:UvrB/UvrC motif-containing protein [Clostridia bacterium]
EKIEKLRAAMNEAVATQDFENAAKIRDEIKALEGGEAK